MSLESPKPANPLTVGTPKVLLPQPCLLVIFGGDGDPCDKTAGTCKELFEHEPWLWTFVDTAGVEPTNNEVERAARHGVLWWKTSGSTDSAEGSRFVERILTVVETCRRQGKNVLD